MNIAPPGNPRAVALLTAGYSCGQVLGPLIVTPLLHEGYRVALLVGADVLLAAAMAAFVLRFSLPAHTLCPTGSDSRPIS